MTLPGFPHIDVFSAGINALNGVLVARHPSHVFSGHADRSPGGFAFRVLAVRDHWKQIVPLEARGEGPSTRAACTLVRIETL